VTEPSSSGEPARPRRHHPDAPPEVVAAADRRAAARVARDFTEADRLRGEIEAAGWKVIDRGTAFRLEPAHPSDVDVGGEVRYGRSDAVPSRLGEPDEPGVTFIVVAREDLVGAARAVRSVLAHESADAEVVLVADGLPDAALLAMDVEGLGAAARGRLELVRTSAQVGQGTAWNIGLRRAGRGVVVVLDASIELAGPVAPQLVAALDDPSVAVTGPWGLVSDDVLRFEEVDAGEVAAIEAYLMAFRRADAAVRGPIDERFRFYRNLDVWWSLVLRDDEIHDEEDEEADLAEPTDSAESLDAPEPAEPGESLDAPEPAEPGEPPARRAVVVPGLPLVRHDHRAWLDTPVAVRDRLSKRNFYRVLDRFGGRSDLAVPPA
jgi:hypothetical protein